MKSHFRTSTTGLVVMLACATGAQASWIDNFDDGSLDNWIVGPATGDMQAVTSFTSTLTGTHTINPRSGDYFAVSRQQTGLKSEMSRTAGFAVGGEQGTTTAWVNLVSYSAATSMLVQVANADGSQALWVTYDRNKTNLQYRFTGGNDTDSGVNRDRIYREWAEIQFVTNAGGTTLFIDGTEVHTMTGLTNVGKVLVAGAFWTESDGLPQLGVDDVSFTSVPEPSSMAFVGAGLGAIALRRRRK